MTNDITNKTLLEQVKYLNVQVQQVLENQDKILKQLEQVLQTAKDWEDFFPLGEMNVLRQEEVTKEDLAKMVEEIKLIDSQAEELTEQFNEYVDFGGRNYMARLIKEYGFNKGFREAKPEQYPELLDKLEKIRDNVWQAYSDYMKAHPAVTGYEDFLQLCEDEAGKGKKHNLPAGD